MHVFPLILGVSFASALLRTLNALHITRLSYAPVVPLALGVSLLDVIVIMTVVRDGIWIFLPIGFGQGLGSVAAMSLFQRLRAGQEERRHPTECLRKEDASSHAP